MCVLWRCSSSVKPPTDYSWADPSDGNVILPSSPHYLSFTWCLFHISLNLFYFLRQLKAALLITVTISVFLPSEVIITSLGKPNVNSSVFVWAPSSVQYITSSVILKPYLSSSCKWSGSTGDRGLMEVDKVKFCVWISVCGFGHLLAEAVCAFQSRIQPGFALVSLLE